MNLQKIIITIIFIFLIKIVYSQDVTIHINSIDVGNGNYINECDTIDFESNENLTLNFWVSLAKTANHTADNATLTIFTKRDDNTFEEVQQAITLTNSSWNGDTFDYNFNITLQASVFEISGGVFYAHFSEDGSQSIQTCNFPIIKDEVPTFEISPSSATVGCNSSSQQTFSVSNVYNSPGNLVYHWSVGNGWKRNGNVVHNFTTSTSNITLTPYQYPPSNVHVTPYLDGVPYDELVSTVSLSSFNPNNYVVGASSVCNSAIYHLHSSLSSGQSVLWHSSDSSLATINQVGNNATLTAVANQSGTVTVTAVIVNSCGQTSNKTFDVFIGAPSVPFSRKHVYGWDNVPVRSHWSVYTNVIEGATGYLWTITPLYSGASGTPAMFETYFGSSTTTTITTVNPRVSVNWGTRSTSYVINCKAVNSCSQQGIGHKIVFVFNQSNNPCRGVGIDLGGLDDHDLNNARPSNTSFSVTIFPNPSKGEDINVRKTDPSFGTGPCNSSAILNKTVINRKTKNKVTIFDVYGNLVFNQFFNTNEFKINTSNFKKGTYFLNIIDNLGESKKSTIVIE